MSGPQKESMQTEAGQKTENQCGVILGCWDHEKTPALILELEQSVNLVERKCKKLLEELVQYKKYLEITGKPDFHLSMLQMKNKKSKNSKFVSGSDPDIAFRKNFINFQKMQQVFEEKFQSRLCNINKELSEAAHKIGLKSNIILFPANDYMKTTKGQAEEENSSWWDVLEKFEKNDFFRAKTKSDSLIIEKNGKSEFSKITKNELELYQKLSRLSMGKRKKKKKLRGRKLKFFCKGKSLRCRQGLAKHMNESENPKSAKKKVKKRKKRVLVPEKGKNHLPREHFSQEKISEEKLNSSEVTENYKSLPNSVSNNSRKSGGEFAKREHKDESSPTLSSAIRKVIPFTTCTSTSRSYNIGLNIQQLYSLSKHRGKMNTRTSTPENATECTKSLVFQNPPNLEKRKVRSKYTGNSATGFLGYHKSTMSQYTNGQKSMIKSESKTAYAVGSQIMVSDCQRTDIFEFGKSNNYFGNASGDGTYNERRAKLSIEWTKVYNSFLNIYRKYTCLKGKISDNLALADDELNSLEKEIDYSIEKYKNFLRFYSKFLHLNHRLKSLKIACETDMFEPVTSFYSDFQEKICRIKPTHSMTVKKAFKEVQSLQDKIRLVND